MTLFKQLAGMIVLACFVAATCAQTPTFTPLPLAGAAKAHPDVDPQTALHQPQAENTAVASILISSHQFDQLDTKAADYLSKYKSREWTANQYVSWLVSLKPTLAGKSALADLREWTKQRPKSFAAWYVLGYQLYDIAGDERGGKSASETSAEQFAAMQFYAEEAQKAFLQAKAVSSVNFPADSMLIGVAVHRRDDSSAGFKQAIASLFRQAPSRYCPASSTTNNAFPGQWAAQLYYFCSAYLQDPNFTRPFKNFAYYGDPSWGGSFKDLEGVLSQVRVEGRSSPAALADMRSYLTFVEGAGARLDGDPHQGIELYVQAFDQSPSPESAWYLTWAADYARDETKDVVRQEQILKKLVDYQPGNFQAWFNLGIICENRNDMRCYMEDMVRAGNLGSTAAQNNIGYFYIIGQRGLPKDLVQARAWLTLAANQGYAHAQEKLTAMGALAKTPGGSGK